MSRGRSSLMSPLVSLLPLVAAEPAEESRLRRSSSVANSLSLTLARIDRQLGRRVALAQVVASLARMCTRMHRACTCMRVHRTHAHVHVPRAIRCSCSSSAHSRGWLELHGPMLSSSSPPRPTIPTSTS